MKMNSIIRFFLIVIVSLTLVSCALSHSTKQINYQSNFNFVNKASSNQTVEIEPMKDARNYDN